MPVLRKKKSVHQTPAEATVANATHSNPNQRREPTVKTVTKKSKSKKHAVTSATPAPATVAEAITPNQEGEQPVMSTSIPQSTSTSTTAATVAKVTPPNPTSIAKSALTALRSMEPGLHLVDALSPEDKVAAGSLARIHPEAITVGIDVAERHPSRFPDFEIDKNRYAVEYAQSMGPIAQQYRDTAARIEETILALQAGATRQTLALYAGMKALSRVPSGQSMLPQIRQMKLLVRTRVKRRATGDDATVTATNDASASPAASSSPSAPAPTAVAHSAPASASPAPVPAASTASPPPTNGATVNSTVVP